MTQAMTQALTTIERAVSRIDAKSRRASRGPGHRGPGPDEHVPGARGGRGRFRLSRGPALRQIMKACRKPATRLVRRSDTPRF